MHDPHVWSALDPIPSRTLALIFVAVQKPKGQEASWVVLVPSRRPTMSLTTQSPVPAIPRRSAARQPNRFMRLVHAIVEARTRMYLAAVTDPATGRIDPDREQQVLRLMTL
jgi:hypothetical protein